MNHINLSAFADEGAQDLAGMIAVLKANQIASIELRTVDSVNIADFDQAKTAQVKTALRAAAITVSCLGTPLGKKPIEDKSATEIERLKRLADTAHALDCTKLRIFSFYVPADQVSSYRDEVMQRLDRMIETADREGVRLLHENEKDIYGDLLARCVDLHQAFGHRLGAIIDPANYIQVGSDPLMAIQQLDPYVEYLHIKDCRKSDGHIVPAGQGDANIAAVLAFYLQHQGRQAVALEPHLFEFAALSSLEKHMTGAPGSGKAVGVGGDYPDAVTAFAAGVNAFKTLAAPYKINA
ncbi:MAG: TIM barrel protein [Eubacteriales bacterium]|nr:TIM barrel protein [Eubacteriales bacterium]